MLDKSLPPIEEMAEILSMMKRYSDNGIEVVVGCDPKTGNWKMTSVEYQNDHALSGSMRRYPLKTTATLNARSRPRNLAIKIHNDLSCLVG